eukprot:GHVU01203356.1.p1 GENE.GHVU01203356.1~~GHVU01203356.1.p1  ORF type:complete len:100 (-),score=4.69 GHVU01203356.1:415-714(-)
MNEHSFSSIHFHPFIFIHSFIHSSIHSFILVPPGYDVPALCSHYRIMITMIIVIWRDHDGWMESVCRIFRLYLTGVRGAAGCSSRAAAPPLTRCTRVSE